MRLTTILTVTLLFVLVLAGHVLVLRNLAG
jgi:hypothetical protein